MKNKNITEEPAAYEESGKGEAKATIHIVAKMAGVSPATVSRYLNNGYVSEEKKMRIRHAIEVTKYTPDPTAQMLRTGKEHLIGVILPKLISESVSAMVDGITEVLEKKNYRALLACTDGNTEKEMEFLKIFRTQNVDGVIFIGTAMTKRHLTLLRSYSKPLVLLGQQEEQLFSVYFDDYQAACLATETLLKAGCQQIAYIGGTLKDREAGRNRRLGYEETLQNHGISYSEESMTEAEFQIESGYAAMEELLKNGVPFDGLFCAVTAVAMGAVACLRQHGISVPEQVKVASVESSYIADLYEPAITTVSLSHRTGGKVAASLLMEIVHADGELPVRNEKMQCCLHEKKPSREEAAEQGI